tara:strand:+ start:461 stop:1360 length:900 start_codon:yes stop_codon:yes gene_type:complete
MNFCLNLKSLTAVVVAAVFAFSAGNTAKAAVIDFNYTGAVQTFIVPTAVSSIFVETWGAQGWSSSNNQGGFGGYTSGDLSVTVGENLWIYVGGQGTQANGNRIPGGGGFNGGGDGQSNHTTTSTVCCVGGGGGASDVRQGLDNLLNRMIVAGGGGGSTSNSGSFGGAGGGLIGGTGGSAAGSTYPGGTGGTQVAGGIGGGTFGEGGDADPNTMTPWNGGGGGGYYGGGVSLAHAGGGGGSSYTGGVDNGFMLQGIWSGDGLIRFTFEADEVTVPEPRLLAIFSLGLIGLGFARRKKKTA